MQIVTKGQKILLLSLFIIEKNACGTKSKALDFAKSGTGVFTLKKYRLIKSDK